jgi:hypothetical protein
MARVYASVKYRYRKIGTASWAGTGASFYLGQALETLVIQELKKKHPGCEIEIREIKFK